MESLVVDTHSIIWYFKKSPELSKLALKTITEVEERGIEIFISSITLVEMAYLIEKKRILQKDLDVLEKAIADEETCFKLYPVDGNVAKALRKVPRDKIPDMPDRIIAATALYLKLPLVTRDNLIRCSDIRTIW